MSDSAFILALKQQVRALERRGDAPGRTSFMLGLGAEDVVLDRGVLHEILPAETEDGASATGFALMLALRAAGRGAPLLWLCGEPRLHPPGLAELGADPARLILVVPPDPATLLRTAVDALRCAGLGAVVIEARTLDLVASRRLALAAEHSGVTALLLRAADATGASVAWTRWRVSSALSTPLAAGAPGAAALDLDLMRHRSGPDGLRWRLEWNRDDQAFRRILPHPSPGAFDAAPSGAVLPLAVRRPATVGNAAVAA